MGMGTMTNVNYLPSYMDCLNVRALDRVVYATVVENEPMSNPATIPYYCRLVFGRHCSHEPMDKCYMEININSYLIVIAHIFHNQTLT